MGLTPPSLKYIIKAKKKYQIKGPVLTFGNQDIYATSSHVSKWIKNERLPLNLPEKIHYSTSRTMAEINKESERFIHAKTFFEMIGIAESQYYDIDKFNFDKPRILHDLEKPFPAKYHNFFRLIIDSGTMEHIFDIKAVMENIVKITKVGGYVLQMLPANNFLNHGFYQFSPTLFYDFYTNNGFEIVESYIIEIKSKIQRFHTYCQDRDYLGLYFNQNNRLGSLFLVRKKKHVRTIKSPAQYIYVRLSKNARAVSREWNKTWFDKIAAFCRQIVPFRYHGIFYNLWSLGKRISSKRKYFDIPK